MRKNVAPIVALLISLLCACEAVQAQRFDAETGLNYCKNRYYASGSGRFLSRDPIENNGYSNNLYEYVNGAPTDWNDALAFSIDIPGIGSLPDPSPIDLSQPQPPSISIPIPTKASNEMNCGGSALRIAQHIDPHDALSTLMNTGWKPGSCACSEKCVSVVAVFFVEKSKLTDPKDIKDSNAAKYGNNDMYPVHFSRCNCGSGDWVNKYGSGGGYVKIPSGNAADSMGPYIRNNNYKTQDVKMLCLRSDDLTCPGCVSSMLQDSKNSCGSGLPSGPVSGISE